MKKLLVISTLLFAISSLASYADSIQSVTHEIRYERYHANGDVHSGGQIEWTLAKGSIDLSDPGQPGLVFDFDVDRDIYLNKDNDFTDHGWDTQFKFSKSYDWGKYKFLGLEYDQKKTTKNVVSEDYNYTTGPIWKLYGGNLETFLAYDRNSMTDADRWGFDVDYDKTWLKKSGKWGSVSLWNNTELHYRFESKNKTYGYKENNLDFYNETSLLYRTPNYGPFYGSVEAYGEMFTNTKDTS
jgi:opacity protein-like surface antigen